MSTSSLSRMFGAILLAAGLATAGPAKSGWFATWEVTNNTGQECNDFEVKVEGANLTELVNIYKNGVENYDPHDIPDPTDTYFHNPRIGTPQVKDGSITVPVSWFDTTKAHPCVEPGTKLTFGIGIVGITGGATGWQLLDPEWTQHDGQGNIPPSGRHKTRVSGFSVVPADSAIYTIYNDSVLPAEVKGLQFLISATQVPFDHMAYGFLPGFGPPQPNFVLQPGQSQAFYIPGIQAGEYLLAQGILDDPTGADPLAPVPFVHQGYLVPEPATLSLLGLGALGLLRARRRRR